MNGMVMICERMKEAARSVNEVIVILITTICQNITVFFLFCSFSLSEKREV